MKVPEKYRDDNHSTKADGCNGVFFIPSIRKGTYLRVICSDGEGWEHVSVSLKSRCPYWDEMCFIKDLFWDEEETVIQYHPPKSDYINNCLNCLHLWKPIGESIPRPPKILVGI